MPEVAINVATSVVLSVSAPFEINSPAVEVGAEGPAHASISRSCEVELVVVSVTVPLAGAVKVNHTSALLFASPVIVEYVAAKVVPETSPPLTVIDVGDEERLLAGAGAGMLKVPEVAPVRPVGPVTMEFAPVAPVTPVGPVTLEGAPVAPVYPVGPGTDEP